MENPTNYKEILTKLRSRTDYPIILSEEEKIALTTEMELLESIIKKEEELKALVNEIKDYT